MALDDERTVGSALHVRYLGGDPAAQDEVFLRYLDHLTERLRDHATRKQLFLRRGSIDDVIDLAVVDALENYLKRPDQYRPERGKTLGGYLVMSAVGDFMNRFERESERDQRLVVGFEDEDWNNLVGGDDPAADVDDAVAVEAMRSRFADLPKDDEERIVLEHVLDGERSNEVVARALGWPTPLTAARTDEINKIKDRLNKRIKRHFRER
jgi:DNA-directed RNA polymerase specialized sigma24 family protein